MGCFNYTCAVSGFPICVGDDVRFLMLTQSPYSDMGAALNERWFVRAPPIRARYNDYGSIEGYEDDFLRDLWMRGLKIDLIAQGVGENTVHDVATSKDMSFEDLLNALWERRVLVSREVHVPACLSPRFSPEIRAVLRNTHALPKTRRTKISRKNPLLVRQAMVREDVWQAMLRTRCEGAPGFRTYRRIIARYIAQSAAASTSIEYHDRHMWPLRDVAPFTIGLGTHIQFVQDTMANGTAGAAFVDALAELGYIQLVLGSTNYSWRPGEPSGQHTNWQIHARFHLAMQRVALARMHDEESKSSNVGRI